MKYILDCSDLNAINNAFLGINNTEKDEVVKSDKKPIVEYDKDEPVVEYEDPYKDKMNICINFQNQIINSLSDIYKGSELKESIAIIKSFIVDFVDAPAFEDQTSNDLKEYFDFISSLIAKMNKDEIEYGLKLLKNKDYNSVQDFIDNMSKEDK